jgi:hypothetical protein
VRKTLYVDRRATESYYFSSILSHLLNAYVSRLIKGYTGLYNFRKEEYEVVNLPVPMENKVSLVKVNRLI